MLKYKNYKLIVPNYKVENEINKHILNNNGSVFHEVALNRIIKETFGSEFYYLVDNPENITHAAPIHITKNKLGSKRYNIRPLYDMPYAGFIGNSNVDVSLFSVGLFESISYVGFPYSMKEEKHLGCSRYGETAMVDLSLTEDDIFKTVIHSKRRNMIRKAIKEGVVIKHFNSIKGLDIFWGILKPFHDRLGYKQLTYDYYKKIFNEYSPKKQAFVLIAFKNNIALSGIFILGNENYMHYYKGASLRGIKNYGHGELLQWEAIKLSKTLGVKFYDLCNLNKEKLPEIYRFKTGISNRIYIYQIFNKNSLGYKIINRINKYL